jgi:sugar porter (SP) family MFS transporter
MISARRPLAAAATPARAPPPQQRAARAAAPPPPRRMLGASAGGSQRRIRPPMGSYARVAAAAAGAGAPGLDGAHAGATAPLAPVLWAVAVAGMGAFSFGYHLGVVNGPLGAIAADLGFAGSAALQGAVVSTSLAGAAAGALGGAGLADAAGRRRALLAAAAPLLAGAALCAGARSLAALLAGRAAVGVGIGLSSALVPLYISEIAPTRLRGVLGSVNQLLICVGILAALLVNVALPATAWRAMFALATVPAALLAAGAATLCPESPAWLALRGDRAGAEAAAAALWGAAGAAQLGGAAARAKAADPTWREVLASPGARVGVTLFILQQLSGVNAIVYFSSDVFARAGVASGAAASAAVGAVNVLGSLGAAALMERAGRKRLLTLSFAGMGAAMAAMAAGLALPALRPVSGPIALVGTLAYIAAFAAGAGPVPGLLVPEMAPARLRGRAVAAAMGAHWAFNFAVGQLFLPAVGAAGVAGVYAFFAAVCAAAVAFTRARVVETAGRSLEDVERAMAATGGA